MTSSRDDVRRSVAGETPQAISDSGRDFDLWHDYLQLGRLVRGGDEEDPNNRSLGWAGRSSLLVDIEDDDNGKANRYREEQDFNHHNSVETGSSAFSPTTSSRESSLFSASSTTAGLRRLHCVSGSEETEDFDVESIAFSLASSSSLFSDPTGRQPRCVSEEEFDLNSGENVAFSLTTATSLFSPPWCVSDGTESTSSVSNTASRRRRRPRRFFAETPNSSRNHSSVSFSVETPITSPSSASFSVETPDTSPSSASSSSDLGGGDGGGSRRPARAHFCQFCKQNGESAEIYLSHSLRSWGRITCPILRRYTCPTCNATGDNAHTRRYCPLAQGAGGDGEQNPGGGALPPLWVLENH